MAGMERFTQRARKVLSLAHQEAERARNNYINTEHLLLGLMDEEGGVAGRVLRELGMTSDRVREVINRVSSVSPDFDPNRVELASGTHQVLEFAVEEARQLGHHYIGTEHILLGLVRVEGTALEVLRRLGLYEDQIRRQTRRVLNENASVSPSPASSIPSRTDVRAKTSSQVLLL
jgi:ATP-dependent Clp protease ATP-binding subunit ClpC